MVKIAQRRETEKKLYPSAKNGRHVIFWLRILEGRITLRDAGWKGSKDNIRKVLLSAM